MIETEKALEKSKNGGTDGSGNISIEVVKPTRYITEESGKSMQ